MEIKIPSDNAKIVTDHSVLEIFATVKRSAHVTAVEMLFVKTAEMNVPIVWQYFAKSAHVSAKFVEREVVSTAWRATI